MKDACKACVNLEEVVWMGCMWRGEEQLDLSGSILHQQPPALDETVVHRSAEGYPLHHLLRLTFQLLRVKQPSFTSLLEKYLTLSDTASFAATDAHMSAAQFCKGMT